MIIGIVTGNVWATRKEDSLNGLKLMVVQRLDLTNNTKHESFVAVDCVGSGVGERVLVVNGRQAEKATGVNDAPVDAAIVGILDDPKAESGE
jgi:ethanolamine utilization protein EutN